MGITFPSLPQEYISLTMMDLYTYKPTSISPTNRSLPKPYNFGPTTVLYYLPRMGCPVDGSCEKRKVKKTNKVSTQVNPNPAAAESLFLGSHITSNVISDITRQGSNMVTKWRKLWLRLSCRTYRIKLCFVRAHVWQSYEASPLVTLLMLSSHVPCFTSYFLYFSSVIRS